MSIQEIKIGDVRFLMPSQLTSVYNIVNGANYTLWNICARRLADLSS